ncbi:unnamed protein product [Rhizophagus irregularis]|nr:unnamed protein product [Rhizophagus irregularis]
MYNPPAFFNDHLPIPSKDRRNKEWIVFKRRKEYQVAKITMKSHKKDMLSVEIWNIASFDPHLGNLYQLEKPARSLTLDIPRKSARTLNVTHKDGNFVTNTPLNLITTNCLCVISTNNQYADGSPVLTNDDSSPTSISESIEYSESDIASTPAIVIDQDRLIDISLKKRSHGSIIDGNARSNIKWDPNTYEGARAEIYAILLALLTCSNGSKVLIYTDSAAAIQAINGILGTRPRNFLVRNNFLLLYRIFRIVRKGNLDLEHKVKGHSGYIWNEKVDELAKLASTSPSTQFNLAHDDINFLPTIDNVKNMMQFFNGL